MCLNSSGLNLSFNFLFCENALLVALLYTSKALVKRLQPLLSPALYLKEMPQNIFTFRYMTLNFFGQFPYVLAKNMYCILTTF